jgi:hypothetical protein
VSRVATHRKVKALATAPNRLELIAEGLPILLNSAEELDHAANQLPKISERARAILVGLAEEEAAKILVLLDVIRCPKSKQKYISRTLRHFYDHLARLLYVEACSWCPFVFEELVKIINYQRFSHYQDGVNGPEYVFRNRLLDDRETFLYTDLVDYGNGSGLEWAVAGPRFVRYNEEEIEQGFSHVPYLRALPLCRALSSAGAFTLEGLRSIAEIWQSLDLNKDTSRTEINCFIEATLQAGKFAVRATDDEIDQICNWQFPMYPLNLSEIEVTQAELEAERVAYNWE